MNDLDRLFRSLDEMPTTDLSRSIEHRASTGSDLGEPSTTRKPPRRLVAAVVAFAVFGAAALFAWRILQPLQIETTTGPIPAAVPWASYSQGWTELPPPPVVHQGAALVWTGSELLYWGGFDEGTNVFTASGHVFDPRTGTWYPLPDAPFALGDPTGVWTGTEAIFLGDDGVIGADSGDLAFNPTSGSWRILADAPSPEAAGSVTAWTGSQLIRFGGGKAGDPSNVEGMAYDPESDAWTRIADAPIGLNAASAVWDGREMIVFGSLLNSGNHAASVAAVGEAYDPATDSWRSIAPSTLSPQASSAVWVPGLGMFAWDYATQGAWYDPATDSWGDQQKLPLQAGECYPDSVRATIQSVFAFYCGNVAVYDPAQDRWVRVGGGLTDVTIEANGQAYQMYRFASLAEAGGVVALAATGITVEESGMPCYGCPGAPTSFWVYKPDAMGPTPQMNPTVDSVVSVTAPVRAGTLVCTANASAVVDPGDRLGIVFTVENVSETTREISTQGATSYVVTDADGLVYDTTQQIPIFGPMVPPVQVEPGSSWESGADDQLVRWDGPLNVTPTCLGTELPALTLEVSAPGPTPTAAEAIDRAATTNGDLLGTCMPIVNGAPTLGVIHPPTPADAPEMPASCSATVALHDGFAVVRLLIITPPGDQAVEGTSDPYYRFSIPEDGRSIEVIVWDVVVTQQRETVVGGWVSVRTAPGKGSTVGWMWGGTAWHGPTKGTCGVLTTSSGPGLIEFINACPLVVGLSTSPSLG